jgi:TolA-binding protein
MNLCTYAAILVSMQRIVCAALLLIATVAEGAPPTTCGGADDYARALCAYQRRSFAEAEAAFRAIVDKDDPDPVTIRAIYFLARTQMKLGRYEEAETLYIRIYSMSKAFYDEWGCDFLLGECRKARGKT